MLVFRNHDSCWQIALKIAVALILASPLDGDEVRSRYREPYPTAASKKGLQVEIVDDALALGIRHAALNVDLAQVVDWNASVFQSDESALAVDPDHIPLNEAYLADLEGKIRTLSDHGVLVNVILLAYASTDARANHFLLHPAYDPAAPNHLGAFNNRTPAGRRVLAAIVGSLAERWSRPSQQFGRVVGYIVGNEVNSHWWWCNRGPASMQEFADDYLQVMRLVHHAIRRQASWARVYLSLEHHWSIRNPAATDRQAFPAREFLDYFAHRARSTPPGDFDWHVAFHPYPEDLFDPCFWEDESAQAQADSPRVTFKNLEVLTSYLRKKALRYRGAVRHIILSEQGFHTPATPDGESIQAAAFCYAYRKVAALDGIDAFILHRHIDHPAEGGLLLGLRRNLPGAAERYPTKKIYHCFRAADTEDWESAFQFALPILGIDRWD